MEFAESSEVLFKENVRRSRANRKCQCAILFGTVFGILLLVICIALAALYSQEVNKSSTEASSIEGTPGSSTEASSTESSTTEGTPGSSTEGTPIPCSNNTKKYEICDDEQCFLLGLEMVKNMNKSVDPCEDFYAYACGGWQRRHPLNGASERKIASVVYHKMRYILKKALERAPFTYPKNDAVMKMVRVYNSCLDTTAIDALGLEPLNELIKQHGGWSISQNYDPTVTVAQRIGKAARDLNVDSLFGIDVRPSRYNSDINVLMVRIKFVRIFVSTHSPAFSSTRLRTYRPLYLPIYLFICLFILFITLSQLKESSLGLKKKDYLGLDADSEKKRKEYKNYMKDVSQMFKVPYAKMEAIYDFEVKLARIVSGKNPDDALKDYTKMVAMQTRTRRNSKDWTITLSFLCQATGFPWSVFKEVLDVLFDRQLTGNEKIEDIPTNRDFLKEISILYKKTNHALLADYIMWQVVRQYVGALPDRYRPFYGDLLTSPYLPRWKQCVEAMFKPFDMPLGLLYVDVNFNDDAKVKIKEMIENVRNSFIQKLPTQTWMDGETQEMAKKKALAIIIEEIGYPAYIKDPAKLKAQYETLNVSDSLMDNIKAMNHFYRMRTLRKFERPVDKKEWTSGSPVVHNAMYFPSLNKIIFFAGILQKPMYSPHYPRYINYGGIGMVIGHEITHAFDETGRFYDKNGNFKDWLSVQSAEKFETKSNCFVKQYDKYKIFAKYANGAMTLNDNIADNGGIKLAFDAYQRWIKKNGNEKVLPGLDLNPNQLFFLGFAQSWCSVYSKDGAYEQLETDVHSTEKYRIIGSLSNFKKFSEVFKCSPNSGMNPVDKCEIW